MMQIFLVWLFQTSPMPLFIGGVTGWMAGLVWGACVMPPVRRAMWAGLSAWAVHLVAVGSGLLREGSMWDYGVVIVVSVAISALRCQRAR